MQRTTPRISLRRVLPLAVCLAVIPPPLWASGTDPAAPGSEIPSTLYANHGQLDGEYPTWLSADVAIDSNGRISGELPDYTRSDMESYLRDHVPGRCLEVTEFYDNDPFPAGQTLDEVLQKSDLVVRGTVTASAPGFERAEPGQLFRIETLTVYRGREQLPYYYFFVPVGRFRAGPYEICKQDARYSAAPEVGDEVVVMAPDVHNWAEHYLDTSRQSSVVLLKGSGVVMPSQFREQHSDLPRSDFLHKVQTYAPGVPQ